MRARPQSALDRGDRCKLATCCLGLDVPCAHVSARSPTRPCFNYAFPVCARARVILIDFLPEPPPPRSLVCFLPIGDAALVTDVGIRLPRLEEQGAASPQGLPQER